MKKKNFLRVCVAEKGTEMPSGLAEISQLEQMLLFISLN